MSNGINTRGGKVAAIIKKLNYIWKGTVQCDYLEIPERGGCERHKMNTAQPQIYLSLPLSFLASFPYHSRKHQLSYSLPSSAVVQNAPSTSP
ncbi:hypothetical protein Pcinc_036410 [Petrolisthes cinctipes]|uniref:Uncharacterized protein n=1 Tax=Petrolisthes cinctipes TaxID=88211 RepID=A0AAE1EME2_PETCI|nr:hypothetical protein Pcinc_036410 [Petrolisthes cinctipes]